MKFKKVHAFSGFDPYIRIEWFDAKRGKEYKTVSIPELCQALNISERTLNRRLECGFSEHELIIIRLYCCGSMDQFGDDWKGFRIVDGYLQTPFGKRLHPNEIEQYTFYMSIAESYKVELRKVKQTNEKLQNLLAQYGGDKVIDFLPRFNDHKKSTA